MTSACQLHAIFRSNRSQSQQRSRWCTGRKKQQSPPKTCCVSFSLPWFAPELSIRVFVCQAVEFNCEGSRCSFTPRCVWVVPVHADFTPLCSSPLPVNAAQGIIFRGPWQVVLKNFCLRYVWEHECSLTMVRAARGDLSWGSHLKWSLGLKSAVSSWISAFLT